MNTYFVLFSMLASAPLLAQGARIQINLDHLKAKADEVVNVNLDGAMLAQGMKLLTHEGSGLEGLQGVYVRSYSFDKPGAYTEADVDAIRKQITGPNWVPFVEVEKKDGESVRVAAYMEQGKQAGLVVLAAEPKELTVVNIVGPIDLSKLGQLHKLGIPPLVRELRRKEKEKEKTKKEEI